MYHFIQLPCKSIQVYSFSESIMRSVEGTHSDKFIRFRECSHLLVLVFNDILSLVTAESQPYMTRLVYVSNRGINTMLKGWLLDHWSQSVTFHITFNTALLNSMSGSRKFLQRRGLNSEAYTCIINFNFFRGWGCGHFLFSC